MLIPSAAFSLLNDMLDALERNYSWSRADAAATMIRHAYAELREIWSAEELAPAYKDLIERLNRIAPLPEQV